MALLVSPKSTIAQELGWFEGEPDWLRERRRRAWSAFESLPLPVWRRSKWWKTEMEGLKVEGVSGDVDKEGSPEGETIGKGLVVQHNVSPVRQRLKPHLAHRGVIFTDLETAVRRYPGLVREHLGSLEDLESSKLLALHAALWSGGVFIYVPSGVEVDQPLWTYFGIDTSGQAVFAHSLIVLEDGARLTYVEEHSSPALHGQGLATAVAEVKVGRGAWIEYILLQNWGREVYHQARRQVRAAGDGWIRWTEVNLGAGIMRSDTNIELEGPGTGAEIRGLFMASGLQHLDLSASVHHLAPRTSSNTLVKGVLAGQARASFEGLVKVHRGAQGADAHLADHVLLLNEKAKLDSVPSLEVEANDVRVSHGATVSQVDTNQLFYLMSRGLPLAVAKQMIVQGFLEPVLRQVVLANLSDRLQQLVMEKLVACKPDVEQKAVGNI